MAGANYEYCQLCDSKALYVGEEDVPEGVEVLHTECLERDRAEREKAFVDRLLAVAMSDLNDDGNPLAAALQARTKRVREHVAQKIDSFREGLLENGYTDDEVLQLLDAAAIARGDNPDTYPLLRRQA